MALITIPRAFGGTLIITVTIQPLAPATQFKISFVSQSKYKVSFVSQSKYKFKFSEAALVLPNSTTQSSATITDASGNLQPSLTGSVTVFYPGGTNSGPLTPANAGAGVYTLTYVTQGPGVYRELWSFTDGSGNPVTDLNEISCAY